MINLNLLSIMTESAGEVVADAFMALFDNSTIDSVVLCTKGITMLSKEVAKAERAKPESESLRQYKLTLTHAKRLRKEAAALPPDQWTDHLLRVMKVNLGDIINYTKAVVVEKDLNNMTRNDTLEVIDATIKAIELRIKALEKKTNK